MKRREFLCTAGALASAMMAAPALGRDAARTYKMGLQLFTIRAPLAADVVGTLKSVQSIGYEDLETYGFDPVSKKYYGLKAEEFKKLLNDLNLTTSSGHYDFFKFLNSPDDELLRYTDQCIEGAIALKQQYITWPWLDPASRTLEKFRLLTSKLNKVGERVNKAGLGFAYHNHDFEFIDHNGENGYNIIMKETDAALVKLQIDLYWAMHSSRLTPSELFAMQPGRFVMWHVKDMHKVSRDYTELGNGSIDYTVILPQASRAGLQYYFLEQGGNFAKDPMTSIEESALFFKKNLEKLLS
jgi:sugar phosphate isomerase/epimerase